MTLVCGWFEIRGHAKSSKKETHKCFDLFIVNTIFHWHQTTTAGFEPTRVTPIDFESIALTARPRCLVFWAISAEEKGAKLWLDQSKGQPQMQQKKDSKCWFRSNDLWVMGPARFLCANLLLNGSDKKGRKQKSPQASIDHTGARTLDPGVISTMLYRLSYTICQHCSNCYCCFCFMMHLAVPQAHGKFLASDATARSTKKQCDVGPVVQYWAIFRH